MDQSVCVYALALERTAKAALRFLDCFAPSGKAETTEYPYPQYQDRPEVLYTEVAQLLARLEADRSSSYSLYWRATDAGSSLGAEHAVLFFTNDGAMIAGLAVRESRAAEALLELQKALGAEWGVVFGDQPPPESAHEFQVLCRTAMAPHIVEGRFFG